MDWKALLDQIAAWATNVGIKIKVVVMLDILYFLSRFDKWQQEFLRVLLKE